jgi:hypothetical protein
MVALLWPKGELISKWQQSLPRTERRTLLRLVAPSEAGLFGSAALHCGATALAPSRAKGRLIFCTVDGLTPNCLAITRTPERPGFANASRIRFSSVGAIGGRPRRLPSLRARASPAIDKLCRDAARREFDMVMAWSVDRLGRSLQDLVGFLSELHALKIDLFLRQTGQASNRPRPHDRPAPAKGGDRPPRQMGKGQPLHTIGSNPRADRARDGINRTRNPMTTEEEAAREYRRAQTQKLLDLFRGAHGRPAKTVEELEAWLGSPEGKAALAYDQTPDGKIIP